MSAAWERLANEAILDIHPYQPGKPVEDLERELGIPAAVKPSFGKGAARS